MRRRQRRVVDRTRVRKIWFFAFLRPGFPGWTSMVLQDPGRIPGNSCQESWGILEGSWQEIQDVQRWVYIGNGTVTTLTLLVSWRDTQDRRSHQKTGQIFEFIDPTTILLRCSKTFVQKNFGRTLKSSILLTYWKDFPDQQFC